MQRSCNYALCGTRVPVEIPGQDDCGQHNKGTESAAGIRYPIETALVSSIWRLPIFGDDFGHGQAAPKGCQAWAVLVTEMIHAGGGLPTLKQSFGASFDPAQVSIVHQFARFHSIILSDLSCLQSGILRLLVQRHRLWVQRHRSATSLSDIAQRH